MQLYLLSLAAVEDVFALQNPESFVNGAEGNNWIWQRVLHHQNAADQSPKYFYPHAVECSSKLASSLNSKTSLIWRYSLRLSQGKGEKR